MRLALNGADLFLQLSDRCSSDWGMIEYSLCRIWMGNKLGRMPNSKHESGRSASNKCLL